MTVPREAKSLRHSDVKCEVSPCLRTKRSSGLGHVQGAAGSRPSGLGFHSLLTEMNQLYLSLHHEPDDLGGWDRVGHGKGQTLGDKRRPSCQVTRTPCVFVETSS